MPTDQTAHPRGTGHGVPCIAVAPLRVGANPIELHPDYPRPPTRTVQTDSRTLLLDPGLTDGLLAIARRAECTMFTAGMAALLILLHRYTGETDVVIGSRSAALRNDLSGDPDFTQLLARVRDSVTALPAGGDTPPDPAILVAGESGDPSRHPLFSVHWACDPLPPVETGCDLHFAMTEEPAGWRVSCSFKTALFDGRTVARLLRHFANVLRTVVADPGQRISTLSVIDDAERRALVIDCNQTATSYPRDTTVVELFTDQAALTPDAIAVICGEQVLTYAELDAASSRLAHELRSRGDAPQTRIAVILDRSPDMVVALLAVMKAGSAYIPLDPSYPEERLAHVFENSQPSAIITRASLVRCLPATGVPVIQVDSDAAAIARHGITAPDRGPLPDDLAYLIYTSGSTGRPKGVQIRHRSLVNLLCALRIQPGMTHSDVLAAVTTISFDMSVVEVFLPLVVGARLVLVTDEASKSGNELLRLLRDHAVTVLQATPVTWQLLMDAGWQGDPPLRMWCGGEAMPRKLAESLLERGSELWNLYGPTETTVWSSVVRVESGVGPVPIGPPIGNTQFYVLDGHGKLAPTGAPGELFIGGDGVGSGYFDLPEATQARFVADSFGPNQPASLYRTGDIVRMRPGATDGYSLEFLGRADHQVKVRGFRIELGEIESTLRGHPALVDAVAVLGQDVTGAAAIWAYVVGRHAPAEPDDGLISELRARLSHSLPAYMHPSSIVCLDALPRTPNGKIDRARLPTPVATNRGKSQPMNVLEQRVAGIWCAVLGQAGVDKTADFFNIGGHSLLAARLLNSINAEFGQQLSLVALFQAPTIEAQARLLAEGGPREYDFRQVVRLQPNGSKPPLIAIHNTGVYYYRLSARLGSEQPLTALQLFDPSLTQSAPPLRLEDIATEYVRLLRRVHPNGPYQLIGWCVGGVLAFEVARQLTDLGHEVSFLALVDAWAPGYLRRLPKVHALLADYSFRWQLIAADWRRVTSRQQNVGAFLSNRMVVRRVLRWLGRPVAEAAPRVDFAARGLSPEHYDQWLLGYLEDAEAGYEPGSFTGRVTLLRGALEPQGPFLDPKMGWTAITAGAVDVVVMDGDHFTVFQGQGLEQMAGKVSLALAASQ